MPEHFIQYYQHSLVYPRLLIPIPSWEGILLIEKLEAFTYFFAAKNSPHCYCTAVRLFKGEPFGKSKPIDKIKLIKDIL